MIKRRAPRKETEEKPATPPPIVAFGKGRPASLSAFIAHKIASATPEKPLTDEHLDGFDEFERYMRRNDMAQPRPLAEWAEWYDAYWTEQEKEEAA